MNMIISLIIREKCANAHILNGKNEEKHQENEEEKKNNNKNTIPKNTLPNY